MQRDASAFLEDALDAADLTQQFTLGRPLDEYRENPMLRSAVERQLKIVGEDLNQAAKVDPTLADLVPELRRMVGFRNVLAHAYAYVDDEIVWTIAVSNVPVLIQVLTDLVAERRITGAST